MMDGVEILGTMAAEGAPWWVFLGLVLVGIMCMCLIGSANIKRVEAVYYGAVAMFIGIFLGMLILQITPEKQIALISDNASYIAVEEQYKVTKIDGHLYFLEVRGDD